MPLMETSGNVTADAYAGGVAVVPKYIEDYFSTWLWTVVSGASAINNGIDLSTKGGMVWIKSRSNAYNNWLTDTTRGPLNIISSNLTDAQTNGGGIGIDSFTTTGWTFNGNNQLNPSGATQASWSFAKAPKFFDVVTWTGNGTSGRAISHSLGSTPGFIIIKRTNTTGNWATWHRSLTSLNYGLYLNTTDSEMFQGWFSNVDSTSFTIGGSSDVNGNGSTYVAYLFAHNAGGFGLTGTDNVISCGSYTGNGSSTRPVITLGYEPQWVMVKRTDSTSDWFMLDIMRGIPNTPGVAAGSAYLFANTSAAEDSAFAPFAALSATGFSLLTSNANLNASGGSYIYIAIRRGPMKVPTDATKVYSATTNAGTGANKTITTNFPVDLSIQSALSAAVHVFTDRLRGGGVNVSPRLYSQFTDAETNTSGGRGILFDSNTSITNTSNYINASGDNYIYYGMQRAPSFFDEVCYTGTGVAGATFSHNLGVAPEMMIVKGRDSAYNWSVYHTGLTSAGYVIALNANEAQYANNNAWNSTAPTSTVFSVGGSGSITNTSAKTYVAYFFATAAGVSKVGKYTGTGATQTISCGFTGGARFVLIKRIDGAEFTPNGSWYVWDTARGMVSGTDPKLALNSTAAESNANWVYTTTGGFQIVTSDASVNASGGSYIFLSVA
jgi:hypothetical protein